MKAYIEPGEIEHLEQAATNLRDKLLIQLLFRLGCRISEGLPLTVEDIARLSRKHSFCPGCGQSVTEAVRKEVEHRRVRTLPVDEETLAVLKDFIDRGGPVLKDGKHLIFGINRHRAWQIVRQCADKAGLPKLVNPETGRLRGVSPHRFRDAFAVNAVKRDDSGDGLRLLQEHLGHASFNTTAKYRKIAGEEHRQWYDKLWTKKEPNGG